MCVCVCVGGGERERERESLYSLMLSHPPFWNHQHNAHPSGLRPLEGKFPTSPGGDDRGYLHCSVKIMCTSVCPLCVWLSDYVSRSLLSVNWQL